jgi:hypothetical protein
MSIAICLIIVAAHMNNSFIIKVKILVLIKWSYMFSQFMLSIESRMVSIF